MKAEFTTAGPVTTTLGDDSIKYAIELEQLGLAAIVQIEALYGSATQFVQGRGNNAGECVFASAKSYASIEAGAADAAAKVVLVGLPGSLVLTINAHTVTMANAVLKSVGRVESDDA